MTTLRRVALAVIAFGSLLVGAWAQVFPRSFYDDFPGFGRVWVAIDGPYNEHLVRDIGGLNLGLALLAVVALVTGSLLLARVAGAAALVYGVPHLVYHAFHLEHFDASDAVTSIVALAVAALAALVALAAPAAPEAPASPGTTDRP
ncbi:MAG: hypothetical protein M3337_01025 [Actinomycetota bacterium]|nr:hypothetical protein [Actinomycetota bacterium]